MKIKFPFIHLFLSLVISNYGFSQKKEIWSEYNGFLFKGKIHRLNLKNRDYQEGKYTRIESKMFLSNIIENKKVLYKITMIDESNDTTYRMNFRSRIINYYKSKYQIKDSSFVYNLNTSCGIYFDKHSDTIRDISTPKLFYYLENDTMCIFVDKGYLSMQITVVKNKGEIDDFVLILNLFNQIALINKYSIKLISESMYFMSINEILGLGND